MATFSFKEEQIPDKLNVSVWLKMFKYLKARWPLVVVLILTMLTTAFYDASFTPLMNAALIKAVATSTSTDIKDLLIDVKLIFGIKSLLIS